MHKLSRLLLRPNGCRSFYSITEMNAKPISAARKSDFGQAVDRHSVKLDDGSVLTYRHKSIINPFTAKVETNPATTITKLDVDTSEVDAFKSSASIFSIPLQSINITTSSSLMPPVKLPESDLPPRVNPLKPGEEREELTAKELDEARALRWKDPGTWTILALARRYKVPPRVIDMEVKAPKEYSLLIKKLYAEKFDAMSWQRKKRQLDRMRRKAEY